jgi:hypothetical protein
MPFIKTHFAALTVAGLFITAASTVRADEWNKRTVITINEPIQLPNTVLPAGTYVFKLLDSPSDRHIVQVFDKDETHLLTTILAIPNYRLQPTGKSAFAFWETQAGNPQALRAWFYPGDNFGQEFAYPKDVSTQIAAINKSSVVTTTAQASDDMKTAPISAVNERGQENNLDTTAYNQRDDSANVVPAPVPEPAPVQAQPAPQIAQNVSAPSPVGVQDPDAAPAPPQLPHTASQMPLIGLAGLMSLGMFFALSREKRVR